MSESVPSMSAEEMLLIYKRSGRKGLINTLCIFNYPKLDSIMEEIVDCSISAFTGEINTSKFIEQMEVLNKKLYSEICDSTLDAFNDGEINAEEMTDCLNELQKKKAKMDDIMKNNL